MLADSKVQKALGTYLVGQVFSSANVSGALSQGLPKPPPGSAARSPLGSVVSPTRSSRSYSPPTPPSAHGGKRTAPPMRS